MLKRINILPGQRFGWLKVIEEVAPVRSGKDARPCRAFLVRCTSCGTEKIVCLRELRSGDTKSCGCMRGHHRLRHGDTTNRKPTPEWYAWAAMKDRCNNPNNKRYKDWG